MERSCSCGRPRRSEGQRYCLECHAAAMRRHRSSREFREWYGALGAEQKKRYRARKRVAQAVRRGRMIKERSCEMCGAAVEEAHHPDYDRPLEVVWLCRPCHLKEHE